MDAEQLSIITVHTYQRIIKLETLIQEAHLKTFTRTMNKNLKKYLDLLNDILAVLDTLVREYRDDNGMYTATI